MMKTFSLPIGKGTQTVSLDEAHVLYDLHGNPVDAVADEQEAIRQALRHPIGSAPLKDVVQAGDTVAIIVSDITRLVHTAQMLPVIVDELNQAASGTNRLPSSRPRGRTAHTPEEDVTVCGEDMVKRVKVVSHDCAMRRS